MSGDQKEGMRKIPDGQAMIVPMVNRRSMEIADRIARMAMTGERHGQLRSSISVCPTVRELLGARAILYNHDWIVWYGEISAHGSRWTCEVSVYRATTLRKVIFAIAEMFVGW